MLQTSSSTHYPDDRETKVGTATGHPFRSSRVPSPVCSTGLKVPTMHAQRKTRISLSCAGHNAHEQARPAKTRTSSSNRSCCLHAHGAQNRRGQSAHCRGPAKPQALRQRVQYWDARALCMAWELRSKVMKLMPTAMGPLIQFMLSPLYRPPMSPSAW